MERCRDVQIDGYIDGYRYIDRYLVCPECVYSPVYLAGYRYTYG